MFFKYIYNIIVETFMNLMYSTVQCTGKYSPPFYFHLFRPHVQERFFFFFLYLNKTQPSLGKSKTLRNKKMFEKHKCCAVQNSKGLHLYNEAKTAR